MAKLFYPSLEGAQHGDKSLPEFLDFAKKHGAGGAQPSNFMLEDKTTGAFLSPEKIMSEFQDRELHFSGISAHCPFWVQTTVWAGDKDIISNFVPKDILTLSPNKIERWAEKYILDLLDLAYILKIKVIPMFWGAVFGPWVAGGYPWGMWKGTNYDLVETGKQRFLSKTDRIREKARKLGLKLAHELHPGSGAICVTDFHMLLEITGFDECLAVNADGSHCVENESWQTRFSIEHGIGKYVYGCHVKDHVKRPNIPVRSINNDWKQRGMRFTELGKGDLDLYAYTEEMIANGYAQRYCRLMETTQAPLVVEAESGFKDLNQTSADGIKYTKDELCFEIAERSFEDNMGA